MVNDLTGIALSGITAYGIKQAVTANNVANLTTPDFKASTVSLEEQKEGGVTAQVSQGTDSVEISREAVDMIATDIGFTANLKVLKTADEMTKKLLDIKA